MSLPGPGAEVTSRLAAVRERLAEAVGRAGRPADAVRLVGVTKGVPGAAVAAALAAGLSDLGESRAQDLLARVAELGSLRGPSGSGPVWHFVGRVQRNKVPALAPVVGLWHSVDRLALGEAIARRAPGAQVLVEVNVAGEAAKGGCRPEEAPALVDDLRHRGLAVVGLMTVPPHRQDPRPTFSALRHLGARLGLSELSMGMSEDFEAAVEEGATIVRIGRAIFGSRTGPGGAGRATGPRSDASSLQR